MADGQRVRDVVVAVRLYREEVMALDAARGSLTRGAFLRLLLLHDRKARAQRQ